MMEILTAIAKTILLGAASGAIAALLGFAKSATVESFDAKKAVQTIIVGAFVGGVAGYYGVEYSRAEEWLGSIGAITLAEYIKKSILKKLCK